MTSQRSFKRLVRTRMDKTGESYTAARAILLGGDEPAAGGGPAGEPSVLVTSDEAIRQRTGRGWEEWFDLLDSWGADTLPHRETARRVAAELSIDPLVWAAQAVTYSYERARGLRVVGQRADGFTITVARTMAVPVGRVYEAFADPACRGLWLPDARLSTRTANPPTSARFDWADGRSRLHVVLQAKGEAKTTAAVEHARLADAAEADRMKAFWRERLTALRAQLEAR